MKWNIIGDSHGRLVQGIYLQDVKTIKNEGTDYERAVHVPRLAFARMDAAEFEHGEPFASLERLAKLKWQLYAAEICAFGGWVDVFLFCHQRFNIEAYCQELKQVALGTVWLHRDTGFGRTVELLTKGNITNPKDVCIWLDIEKDVAFCLKPDVANKFAEILRLSKFEPVDFAQAEAA